MNNDKMTVKKLIELLQTMDGNKEIFLHENDEYFPLYASNILEVGNNKTEYSEKEVIEETKKNNVIVFF